MMLQEHRLPNGTAVDTSKVTTNSVPIAVLSSTAHKSSQAMFNHNHKHKTSPLAITSNNIDDVIDADDDNDVLFPLPAHHDSASPLSHSPTTRSLLTSPRAHRQRAHTMDTAVVLSRHNSSNGTGSAGLHLPQHIARDPIQPKQGSIQDIHSSARDDEDDEIGDVFAELPAMRPRSSTCPANMNRARRAKLRSLRRPPTPPPMDLIEPAGVSDALRAASARTTISNSIEEELDTSDTIANNSLKR